jgi:hypothetical protein
MPGFAEFFTDPFSLMRRFREEMDRVFSRSFGEEFGYVRIDRKACADGVPENA